MRLQRPVLHLLLMLALVIGVSTNGPVIMLGEEVLGAELIFNPFSDVLLLRCQGDQTLGWKTPVPANYSNITEEYRPGSRPTYISTLLVPEPLPEDTGYFTCFYNTKPTAGARTPQVKTYIYFDDRESDYVIKDDPMLVTGFAGEELTIECRTTNPATTVKLFRAGVDISSDDKNVEFDSHRGYVLKALTVQMSGQYQCRIDASNKTKSVIMRVMVSDRPSLQRPQISSPSNTNFVVGHPFTLYCTVAWNKAVTFTWTKPDYTDTDQPSETVNGNNASKNASLVVENASLKDAGKYTCSVSAMGVSPVESSKDINILETMEPFVNVTSDIKYVNDMEGNSVDWGCSVRSFPNNFVFTYYTPQNQPLVEDTRVSTERNTEMSELWLGFTKILPQDFGTWRVVVTIDNGLSDSKSIEIRVISAPVVSVMVPYHVAPDVQFDSTCFITAYPMPPFKSINWKINDTQIQVDALKDSSQHAGNVMELEVRQQMQYSSYIGCSAQNRIGSAENRTLVVVTDLMDRWVLQHDGREGMRMLVKEDSTLVEQVVVVENDPFLITCAVTSLLYESPTFTVPDGVSKSSEIKTQYSSSATTMNSPVRLGQHAGEYQCSTRLLANSQTYSKYLEVIVEEEIAVKLNEETSNVLLDDVADIAVMAVEGFTVVCDASGNPPPLIKWKKDNDPLQFNEEEGTTLSDDGTKVQIRYFSAENQGLYSCIITWRNTVLTAEANLYLNVSMTLANKVMLSLAVAVIIVLVSASVYLVKKLKKEKAKSEEQKRTQKYLFQEGNVNQLNMDMTADEQAELLPYDKSFEVERDKINIGRQLGSGAFGRVVKANVKGLREDEDETAVAVKMCKSVNDPSHLRNLAIELKIMIHLGKHLNIVNLLGACTSEIIKGELWLLVEYCKYGDLLSFLHRYRKRFVNQIDPLTDVINYNILYMTPNSVVSPLSPGIGPTSNRVTGASSVVTAADGYLMPNKVPEPLVLCNPPKGRPLSRIPQTPTSPLSPGMAPGSSPFFAGNPGYGFLESTTPSTPDTPNVVGFQQPDVKTSPLKEPLHAAPNLPPPSALYVNLNPSPGTPSSKIAVGVNIPNSPTSSVSSPGTPVSPAVPGTPSNQEAPLSAVPPAYVQHRYSGAGPKTPRKTSNRMTGSSESSIGRESFPYTFGSTQGSYRQATTDMTTLTSGYRATSPEGFLDSQGNFQNHDGTSIPGLSCPFTTTELVCWSWQVAQGMEYLTKRKVLHGDLAARNLLLAEGNVIKISDFGLSRDMYKKEIYTKEGDDLLPIKWMSVEAIRDRIFSTESDIWAYGVVLWELFSLGQAPYPGVDVNPQFVQDLEAGVRNRQPKYSNKDIYQLMLDCWMEEPEDRPSFFVIRKRLDAMLKDDIKDNFATMNECYVRMNQEYFENRTDYLSMFTSPDFNNIQKSAEDPRYINVEGCVAGVPDNYMKMHNNALAAEAGGGYLPMQALTAVHAPSVTNDMGAGIEPSAIFSPNPVDAAPQSKRFDFHNNEDLPTKQVEATIINSNASSPNTTLLPHITEEKQQNYREHPETDDEQQHEDNTLLHSQQQQQQQENMPYVNIPPTQRPKPDVTYLNYRA